MNNLYSRLIEILINFIDKNNKNYIFNFLQKKSLKKELIIFDIGAHKGETLEMFLKNFEIKKIYCFEPNQKIFNNLENNKKFKDKKISFFNFGFGDKQEYKSLNIFSDTSSSAFNSINQKSKYFQRKKKY